MHFRHLKHRNLSRSILMQSYQQEHGVCPKDKLVDEAIAITPRHIKLFEVPFQVCQAWLDFKEKLAALSFTNKILQNIAKPTCDPSKHF